MTTKENVIETDVLVIGGGMAGLFAAIKARGEGVSVTLVDKNYVSRSGTTCFCDGQFSVFNPKWGHDIEFWQNHISKTGEYMNNPEWTEITLKESYERLKDLMSWGVSPAKENNGEIAFESFPGLPSSQITPINLSHGWNYLPIMRQHALKIGVTIMDRIMVTDLLKQDESVVGAVGFSTLTGEFHVFKAKATVISTGGGNFRPNAGVAPADHDSSDGDAMAYRAGAEISGKEFAMGTRYGAFIKKWTEEERVSLKGRKVNTTIGDYPKTAYFFSPMLMTGNLIDAEGYGKTSFRRDEMLVIHEGRGPFLTDYDNVTPEVWEWSNHSPSYMMDKSNGNLERFQKVGMDPRRATGLWSGLSRYEYGVGMSWGGSAGISSTNTDGATTLPGLYAAGDSYHNTSIGASYPAAGTGTRNAAVTGAIAGQSAAEYSKHVKTVKPGNQQIARLKSNTYAPLERKGGFDSTWVTQQIQYNTLPYYILYVRHGDRLKSALKNVEFLQSHIAPLIYARNSHGLRFAHETKNRLYNAEALLRSTLFRKESRGIHYREDYPRRDDPNWLAWVKIKNDHGEMKLTKNTSPRKWWGEQISSIPYKERYPNRYKGENV
ncbi:MAG: FAD-binding protein [Dehalococcoidales bacterium]|nr:FAD-binding protein [Dehalococcoidales bacterium]